MELKDKPRNNQHPNSLKNLRPQKAGEPSHNPNGRPKKDVSLTSLLKEELLKIAPLKGNKDKTWLEIIVMGWMAGAAKGNPMLLKELIERVEGKVVQPIGGENGQPIKYSISVLSDTAKKLTEEVIQGLV
jgi:hypothetical protein